MWFSGSSGFPEQCGATKYRGKDLAHLGLGGSDGMRETFDSMWANFSLFFLLSTEAPHGMD